MSSPPHAGRSGVLGSPFQLEYNQSTELAKLHDRIARLEGQNTILQAKLNSRAEAYATLARLEHAATRLDAEHTRLRHQYEEREEAFAMAWANLSQLANQKRGQLLARNRYLEDRAAALVPMLAGTPRSRAPRPLVLSPCR